MDINDVLEKIDQYFPISPEQYLKDYVEKVQRTIINCYETEEYQMAHFNIYLLFMTYIYLVVYQTRTLNPQDHMLIIDYIRTYNNRDKDLINIDNIFAYSEVPDGEILKMLSLINVNKSTVGQYRGASKNRDPMAHATGYYVINDQYDFESKTATLLNYFEEINNKLILKFKEFYMHFINKEINAEQFAQLVLFEELSISYSEYQFLRKLKINKFDENAKIQHIEILKNISETPELN